MKKIVTLLLCVSFLHSLFARINPAHYKVVALSTKETFILNSGARSLIGGKSRTYLLVELPPNTVEWYYAVTTVPVKLPAQAIGLAEQLIKLFFSANGLASAVLCSLIIPGRLRGL